MSRYKNLAEISEEVLQENTIKIEKLKKKRADLRQKEMVLMKQIHILSGEIKKLRNFNEKITKSKMI
jgi:DNA gyrase/topoisomerase IV subunit B